MQTANIQNIQPTADGIYGNDTVEVTSGTFNVGDVVTLKEGGSRMTVTYAGPVSLNQGEWLVCEWFDEHGELRRETFAPSSVRAEPRSISAGSVLWNQVGRAA